MQRSSVGYSLAHWKNICPRQPEFGLKEDILFLKIVYFLYFGVLGGAAKLRWAGGRAAPRWAWQRAQKDGCAQRTGAHARPKPTSLSYIYLGSSVCLSSCHIPSCRPVIFLSSCHICGTLSYSLRFSNQTDQGDETEGLEREGLRWRDRKGTDCRGRV